MRRFWSPDDFESDSSSVPSEHEAAEVCRDLLTKSVHLRLGSDEQTWAQLSGGLDSSAVVSVAQWMFEHGRSPRGLAGTITYVDRHGTGADEREYSDAVVSRWRLCNTAIVDPPFCTTTIARCRAQTFPRPRYRFTPESTDCARYCDVLAGAYYLPAWEAMNYLRAQCSFSPTSSPVFVSGQPYERWQAARRWDACLFGTSHIGMRYCHSSLGVFKTTLAEIVDGCLRGCVKR